MTHLIFTADERITPIPNQNDVPDMIQVSGSCPGTKLTVLTVRLTNGSVSGDINPKKAGGVVLAPKHEFEELRDCFDNFPIEIDLTCTNNGTNYSVTAMRSTSVPVAAVG